MRIDISPFFFHGILHCRMMTKSMVETQFFFYSNLYNNLINCVNLNDLFVLKYSLLQHVFQKMKLIKEILLFSIIVKVESQCEEIGDEDVAAQLSRFFIFSPFPLITLPIGGILRKFFFMFLMFICDLCLILLIFRCPTDNKNDNSQGKYRTKIKKKSEYQKFVNLTSAFYLAYFSYKALLNFGLSDYENHHSSQKIRC